MILQRAKILFLFVLLSLICSCQSDTLKPFDWPKVTATTKPWTYWWWLGSAVDKENLTYNLETYQKGGMGGVHIIPIYGVKGEEENFINYLTPEWMDMLAFTKNECQRLGMDVDMTIGTGWPYGGPSVTAEQSSSRLVVFTLDVKGKVKKDLFKASEKLFERRGRKSNRKRDIIAATAVSNEEKRLNITSQINPKGELNWQAPSGTWTVYTLFLESEMQQVKRAAPGAEGRVVDPFSIDALDAYLNHFDKAFKNYKGNMVRSFYHDSYEYYGAEWTRNFLKEFMKRRGYDLLEKMPEFLGKGDKDITARIKADYRLTLAELHEEFILRTADWSHEKGALLRNQAHGSPTNILDTYAAADIPEIEIFGSTEFDIPGLRREPGFINEDIIDPLVLRFSSSAAHVSGKNLVASETCTWLADHFRVSLSQAKPEIDQLFLSGVNHIVYHGMAYSPKDDPWPGWQFYASTSFAPTNSIWQDMPLLNAYIARCQSVLQYGVPDNDVLVYFPVWDIWHNPEGNTIGLQVHNPARWLYPFNYYPLVKQLKEQGYAFDYISDKQINALKLKDGDIISAMSRYKTIIIPSCDLMPVQTMKTLKKLVHQGAKVIFMDKVTKDVPGYYNLDKRRQLINTVISDLPQSGGKWGQGHVFVGNDINSLLEKCDVKKEHLGDFNVNYIRRRFDGGRYYFMANQHSNTLDNWVTLACPAKSAIIFDPLTGKSGLAKLKTSEDGSVAVYLQIEPGASFILKVLDSEVDGPNWVYSFPQNNAYNITGEWYVQFLSGGPQLPPEAKTRDLVSWTQFSEEAERFAGTAVYKIRFRKPEVNAKSWILDLGLVRESARVRINGQDVGAVWSLPFRLPIHNMLKEGENDLEITVTNLSANRIRDLDKRGVQWKKFHEINFVNIHYKPFDASNWELVDSGLLGPVKLYPAEIK